MALGLTSLVMAFSDRITIAAYCIIGAAFFDVFDGLAARLLKATSEFGKQLDSLSDLVSFGVAPSMILYQLLIMTFVNNSEGGTFLVENATLTQSLILYSAYTPALFGAIRLARFNITDKKKGVFYGLPIPAAALFIVAIWLVLANTHSDAIRNLIINFKFLFVFNGLLAFLMVSNIQLLALQFDGLSLRKNFPRYLVIASGIVLITLFKEMGIIHTMGLYLVISLIFVSFRA